MSQQVVPQACGPPTFNSMNLGAPEDYRREPHLLRSKVPVELQKENDSTMHFRKLSTLSLLPGANSSNPMTIRHCCSKLHGCRSNVSVINCCKNGDAETDSDSKRHGSNKVHRKVRSLPLSGMSMWIAIELARALEALRIVLSVMRSSLTFDSFRVVTMRCRETLEQIPVFAIRCSTDNE